jgi:hypothetical protein
VETNGNFLAEQRKQCKGNNKVNLSYFCFGYGGDT